MTIKTIQFFGQGYGSTPVSLTVKVNGIDFFVGEVSTIHQDPPEGLSTEDQVLLFTMPMEPDFHSNLPMSITVSGGYCAILGIVTSNYSPTGPGTNTGPDIYAPINSGDARANVAIDGELQTAEGRDDDHKGSWAWVVPTGKTLSYDLVIV